MLFDTFWCSGAVWCFKVPIANALRSGGASAFMLGIRGEKKPVRKRAPQVGVIARK